jgi:ABC-2 type transport system permease protein
MTTDSLSASLEPSAQRPSLARIYRLEAKLEFLKVLRMPAFAIPTLAFPVLFYSFFGLVFKSPGAISFATYLMATYGAFGVIGASLFGFGVGVAVERGQGWMLLKRASPMPLGAYFAAKIAMSALFGALIIAMLYTLGAVFGGVEMPLSSWALLAVVHIAGALPFCAMGLALGTAAGPNSAPAIVNIVYLPMGFLSGLWIPIDALPDLIQKIARALPAYHYAQLALRVVEADQGRPLAEHLGYLAIFSGVCLLLAWVGLRRDRDQTYG